MADEIKRGGKRTRKTPTAEAEKKVTQEPVPPPNSGQSPVRKESDADRILRNIFFRSGPVPMAPDNPQKP